MCLLLRSGFRLATIKAWLVECSTEELWSSVRVTIWFLVTSLTKALFPQRVLWDLQCCRHVLVPFPRSVPWHNPFSELYGQFLRPHGLVFALTWSVNCETLSRQVCAFPNHVQSIEFTTGGLQSNCRNISRIINGNRMHLSSISSLIAKGLNSYVNKVLLFFIINTFEKISKKRFLFCH
jgi:hypothetical protein